MSGFSRSSQRTRRRDFKDSQGLATDNHILAQHNQRVKNMSYMFKLAFSIIKNIRKAIKNLMSAAKFNVFEDLTNLTKELTKYSDDLSRMAHGLQPSELLKCELLLDQYTLSPGFRVV